MSSKQNDGPPKAGARTPPNWPFPTKDRPLTPIAERKPAKPTYPGDMDGAPW